MNTLIEQVLQWGIDKGITGPGGKGTTLGQADKMIEEAGETFLAVDDYVEAAGLGEMEKMEGLFTEIKDGIGDTVVTLILLAELHGLTLEECLQHAYDEIKGRTGRLVDGTFVKNK
jgi:NTP pyrophosphatase (non-canonical NTP hydrolase)